MEASHYQPIAGTVHHDRGKSASSFAETISIPNTNTESMPLSPTAEQGHTRQHSTDPTFGRKRSLIRPERNRIDRDHRNYHYHKHAANMSVIPSSTGNDPILDELEGSTDRSNSNVQDPSSTGSPPRRSRRNDHDDQEKGLANVKSQPARVKSGKISKRSSKHQGKRRSKIQEEQIRPPSVWNFYCHVVTFWAPDFILRHMGWPTKAQRRAWREKMGLVSIILIIMAIVGFLTFGFTAAVCGTPPDRKSVV